MKKVMCCVLLLCVVSCTRLATSERRLLNAHVSQLETMSATGEATQAQLDSVAKNAEKLQESLTQETYWSIFWTNAWEGFTP